MQLAPHPAYLNGKTIPAFAAAGFNRLATVSRSHPSPKTRGSFLLAVGTA
jgi:hypothetical protein